MNTIIEKIRAKIEQMLHSIENCPFISGELGAREKEMGEVMAYKNILSILSDLEKEEKPIEGLEEEIERYISISLAVKFPTTYSETIKADIRYIARHFAKWGAEHLKK